MNWRIIAVGKPRLDYARLGIEEYTKRLRVAGRVEWDYIRAGRNESKTLLQRSAGLWRVAMDERGVHESSREFARRIEDWENKGIRQAALLVGGSDGHSDAVREQSDFIWSLGRMTLQHELALLVALEQIYRAHTIRTGAPYHRD
jgi:23S rRNA (pseudouridine1915-N3)-methyltransferase